MSKTSDIDSLIGKNKEILRKIEQSRKRLIESNEGKVLSFREKFLRHWNAHSQTWSNVVFSGCILVLSLRLLNLRKESKEIQDSLEIENSNLRMTNQRLRSNMSRVETSWSTILQELKSDRWTSGKIFDKIETLINETRDATKEEEVTKKDKDKKPKQKGFLI